MGNRLSSLGLSPYAYNVSNQLTSTPNASYGYDNNGNAVTRNDSSGITTFAWDFENRLTSVTLPGSSGTVSLKYDPFGRRIYKSSSAGTSIFAFDGDNIVEETNASGAVVARYAQTENIDEPLAMLRSGATSFYQADGLGSITSLSNTSGSLAQTYTYDSFGKQTASSGSLTNPFRYTAREFDAETNLYFNRARYFDPTAGRFISEDPIRFAADVNFYDYVYNHPTGAKDPSGLDPTQTGIRLGIQILSYYLCADQIKQKFNHFSREGHPRYAHCMASCNLVKQCGGNAAAFLTGYAKELGDLRDCLWTGSVTSCNTAFQPSDLKDNAQGRKCPKKKSCEEQCADLRNEPDGPPSPFVWWPTIRIFGGVANGLL